MTHISSLEDHIGYWLRCLSNNVSGSFAARVERHGVTVAQWVVLRTLYGRPPLSLNDAAALVGVDKSSLSRMTERLLAKKLVARAAADGDARAVRLSLTAAGRRIVPVLAREADENDRAYFKSLSAAQRREFLGLIHKLLDTNEWSVAAHGADRLQ